MLSISFFFGCGRLKSAGAVLVAKLVTGSLAYDDIWFGGRTRNPWNIEEFTTGSSAGPAACTSAGCCSVLFARCVPKQYVVHNSLSGSFEVLTFGIYADFISMKLYAHTLLTKCSTYSTLFEHASFKN